MSRGERKAMIARDCPGLSLSRQCRVLAIGRSSFYSAPKGESPENLALMRRIDELFMKYPFYGSRQMVRQLRREGVCVGRHRVRRLMRLMGLEAIYQAPRTSDPKSGAPGLSVSSQRDGDRDAQPGLVAPTSPISRSSAGSCTWLRSWTGRPAMCSPGGYRIPWTPPSASRPWKRRWPDTASRSYSIPTRAASSPASTSPAYSGGAEGHDLHGWPGPLHGQYIHRTSVAVAQIRGHLPARTDRRLCRRAGHRRVDRLLQHRAAPFVPRRSDAGGSLRRRAAHGYDG